MEERFLVACRCRRRYRAEQTDVQRSNLFVEVHATVD
jgi:hypothetical protein